MIVLKSTRDIQVMRKAGAIASAARALAGTMVKPGMTTEDINRAVHEFITEKGAIPSFLNYNGYPKSVCVSVNDEVIHGIPGSRRIRNGDIVSIDVGACFGGLHGDCAATYTAGEVSEEKLRLIRATREAFYEAVKFAVAGKRVYDISYAVQQYAERNGYTVVRDYVGHGIGSKLHEEPEVPNFGKPGHGARLMPGMTLAIEPMVNMGCADIKVLSDGWTVVTADGKPSAHYENTVLVTSGEAELLTPPEGDGWV